MERIEPIIAKHIISEPGDGTRYDYIVMRNKYIFMFIPYGNTFKYPTKLYYYDIVKINDIKDCIRHIDRFEDLKGVNPHTLLECVKRVKKMFKEKTI